jgi:hypothetical protein
LKQPATKIEQLAASLLKSTGLLQLDPTDLSQVVFVKSAASLLSDLRQTCPQQTIFVLSQQMFALFPCCWGTNRKCE